MVQRVQTHWHDFRELTSVDGHTVSVLKEDKHIPYSLENKLLVKYF